MRGNATLPSLPRSTSSMDEVSLKRTLMDVIIETISKCSDEYDDLVQLQVKMNFVYNIFSLSNQMLPLQ